MAEEVGSIYYEVDSRTDGLIVAESQVQKSTSKMVKSFDKTDKSVARVGKTFDATQKKTQKLSNSMRQASLQLSQVAQQGSVTGNYFQALAVQLPDLALGFGTLGVLAGAAAGVFAVPLYNAFTGSSGAATDLRESIAKLREEVRAAGKDVLGSLDKLALTNETRALEDALKDLNAQERSLRAAARDLIIDTTGIDDGFFTPASDTEVQSAAIRRIKENAKVIQAAEKIENDKSSELAKDAEGDRLAAIFQAREQAGLRRVSQIKSQSQSELEASNEKLSADLDLIDAAQLSLAEKNEAEAQARQLHADRLEAIDAKRTRSEEAQQKNRLALKQAEISAYSQLGGQLTNLVSAAGAEQTAIGRAVFLANQALAVANIIVSTQQAAGQALAIGGPIAGPGLAANVTALGYASAGIAAGVAVGQTFSGRQTGGPVSGGTPYRVNETGPELFSSGGRQYLIPDQNGNVSKGSSGSGGGGQNITINVNNLPAGLSAESTSSTNDNGLTVDLFITDITEGGEMSRSLERAYVSLDRRTD